MPRQKTRTKIRTRKPQAPKLVPAVDRTIQVLNAFTNGSSNPGVSELARELKINKSTLHGILNTLAHYHWLERDERSKTYRLGFALYALGNRAGAQIDLLAIAHPFVTQLAHEVQETIMLTTYRGEHILLIDVEQAPHDLKVSAEVGKRMPYNAGAFGLVFNAAMSRAELDDLVRRRGFRTFTPKSIGDLHTYSQVLERVRVQGYALESEEYIGGLCGVAAPIVNLQGQVTASLGIVGFRSRLPDERLETLARRVRQVAQEVSFRLGAPAYPMWHGTVGQTLLIFRHPSHMKRRCF